MKKQLNIRIDEDLYKKLKEYTKFIGVGYSSKIQNAVEIAIKDFLEKHPRDKC